MNLWVAGEPTGERGREPSSPEQAPPRRTSRGAARGPARRRHRRRPYCCSPLPRPPPAAAAAGAPPCAAEIGTPSRRHTTRRRTPRRPPSSPSRRRYGPRPYGKGPAGQREGRVGFIGVTPAVRRAPGTGTICFVSRRGGVSSIVGPFNGRRQERPPRMKRKRRCERGGETAS